MGAFQPTAKPRTAPSQLPNALRPPCCVAVPVPENKCQAAISLHVFTSPTVDLALRQSKVWTSTSLWEAWRLRSKSSFFFFKILRLQSQRVKDALQVNYAGVRLKAFKLTVHTLNWLLVCFLNRNCGQQSVHCALEAAGNPEASLISSSYAAFCCLYQHDSAFMAGLAHSSKILCYVFSVFNRIQNPHHQHIINHLCKIYWKIRKNTQSIDPK